MSILEAIEQWPVDHVAAAAIGRDGVVETAGEIDTVFPLASVTKLFVATAVLVATEEGTLDLDMAAGPEGSTLRHLLAHASGLDADTDRVLAAPGTRRIYSNSGFAALGRVLEEHSGLDVASYVTEAVLEPLGLTATTMSDTAHTGARGTVVDLARFAADLLADAPALIAPTTRDLATRVAFPGLAGVLPGFGRQDPNDWGLGFEVRGTKAPHWTPDTASASTVGHFGRSGSLLWVDREAGAALVVLGDRDFGDWAPARWRDLGARVLATGVTQESGPSRQGRGAPADDKSAVVDSGVSR